MDELSDAIGAAPPAAFEELGAQDRTRLAALVGDAARRRSAALDHAVEDSLRYVPSLLRGTVRRSLGL